MDSSKLYYSSHGSISNREEANSGSMLDWHASVRRDDGSP